MTSSRKEPLLKMWLDDLVKSARALIATPLYALPALVSLMLGIGTTTAIFAIFSAVMLRPLPFPREHELVSVGLRGAAAEEKSGISATYAAEFKEMRAIFASFASVGTAVVTVTGNGDARRVVSGKVTPEFFDTLQVEPEIGRTFTAAGPSPDGVDVAVLGHAFWRSAYGGQPVVGRTIIIDAVPKTILGVISDDRALPTGAEVWEPVRFTEADLSNRFRLFLNGVGRLSPGTSLPVAQQMLRAATERQNIRVPDGTLVYGSVVPLRDELVGGTRSGASIMMAAVAVFLLLACANVAALLATRASVRARDLAVRSALGASPAALARHSALEAIVLTVVGSVLGLGLAVALVGAANSAYATELAHTPARLDVRVILAFVTLALISAAIVGLAPAMHARRVRPMETLRAGGRSSSSKGARRFRELLVALQVAATVVLLTSAAVLVRSARLMDAVDPGIDTSTVGARVLFSPLYKDDPARTDAFARAVLERAEQLPGIRGAAIASDLPFDGSTPSLGLELEPGAPNKIGYADVHLVSPNYFRTIGMKLLAGRGFTDADLPPVESATGVRTAIVSRTFATKLLGTLNAVGHRFHPTQPTGDVKLWFEVIGVVEDALDVSITRPIVPAAYFPFTSEVKFWGTGFAVIARGEGDPGPLLEALPKVTLDVDRDAVLCDANVLKNMIERTYRDRTSLEKLMVALAIMSIVLAAIGLFGITSYTVAERLGEIGIRRALGATRADIIALILRETALLVGAGVAAGLLCALGTRSLLASFLYGIAPGDAVTYAAVSVGVLVVALLATLAPACAAAAVQPSRALQVH